MSKKETVIIAYKGFDKDMKCRGFQYEVGKSYEMDGDIKCCERGFHACTNPLDVLNHYNDIDGKYAVVEQSGSICKGEDGDSKTASSKIHIKAEIGFTGLFKAGIEWLKEITKHSTEHNDNGGDYAKIGSSGDYAQIGSSGYYAQINSTGEDSVICCSGINSRVKAKVGSWITLSEWIYSDEKKRYIPKCVKTEYVDGEKIKADTWYILQNGEFKEVE